MEAPKYSSFREFTQRMRLRLDILSSKVQGKDTQIYTEMNSCPPKPLQVCALACARGTACA